MRQARLGWRTDSGSGAEHQNLRCRVPLIKVHWDGVDFNFAPQAPRLVRPAPRPNKVHPASSIGHCRGLTCRASADPVYAVIRNSQIPGRPCHLPLASALFSSGLKPALNTPQALGKLSRALLIPAPSQEASMQSVVGIFASRSAAEAAVLGLMAVSCSPTVHHFAERRGGQSPSRGLDHHRRRTGRNWRGCRRRGGRRHRCQRRIVPGGCGRQSAGARRWNNFCNRAWRCRAAGARRSRRRGEPGRGLRACSGHRRPQGRHIRIPRAVKLARLALRGCDCQVCGPCWRPPGARCGPHSIPPSPARSNL